jgi:hypothetical protein
MSPSLYEMAVKEKEGIRGFARGPLDYLGFSEERAKRG